MYGDNFDLRNTSVQYPCTTVSTQYLEINSRILFWEKFPVDCSLLGIPLDLHTTLRIT